MSELYFKRLVSADKALYDQYYQKTNTCLTDLTFNCRIAWDEVFKTEMAIYLDSCLLISDGGRFTDPHLLMPLGEMDSQKLDEILLAVSSEFQKRGWKLKVMCIDEKQLELFENLSHFRTDINYNEDSSDYIYDAEALRSLSGNILHKKRNHVNKFMRLYPDFKFSRIQKADEEDCLALVKAWCVSKNIDPEDIVESDYRVIKRLFTDFEQLDIYGGVIRISGEVKAFALGSKGNDNCAYIHFEKADQSVHGIYAAINQLVLQEEFPTTAFVNREEDLGIPGLRKAKQSYAPISIRHKYKTWIEAK